MPLSSSPRGRARSEAGWRSRRGVGRGRGSCPARRRRLDLGLRRCLVVEGGEHEPVGGRLDQHAGEDRLRVALRQQLDDERHGFAEHIAIDVELHGAPVVDVAGLHAIRRAVPGAGRFARALQACSALRRQGCRNFALTLYLFTVLTAVETVDNVRVARGMTADLEPSDLCTVCGFANGCLLPTPNVEHVFCTGEPSNSTGLPRLLVNYPQVFHTVGIAS